jgi:hypothetical protein
MRVYKLLSIQLIHENNGHSIREHNNENFLAIARVVTRNTRECEREREREEKIVLYH